MGLNIAIRAWIELELGQTGVILQINTVMRTLEKKKCLYPVRAGIK